MEMMIGDLVRVSDPESRPLKQRGAIGLVIARDPAQYAKVDGPTSDAYVYTVLWSQPSVPMRIYSDDAEVVVEAAP